MVILFQPKMHQGTKALSLKKTLNFKQHLEGVKDKLKIEIISSANWLEQAEDVERMSYVFHPWH